VAKAAVADATVAVMVAAMTTNAVAAVATKLMKS